jgi:Uma2 family endonuclease
MNVSTGRELEYVRAPRPIHFPVHEAVGESKRHLEARTLLYQVLKLAFAERAAIGSDQFVYWDPTDPSECLSPDAFVRLGEPDSLFQSWKVWERGAPQVAVEIISASDARDRDWDGKLRKYARLGVCELVRFDPRAREGALRIWDSVEQDLVERKLTAGPAPSNLLPGFWLVREDPTNGPMLRLSRDALAAELYPSPGERVAELEAELARRR